MSKQQVININLSTRLAPVLEQAIDLTPNISNHIRYNIVSSSSFNHQVPLSASMLPLLSQVLTIRERRRFESIPIQLEGYS